MGTFAKKNIQTGLIEIIDDQSFEVVAVQKSAISLVNMRDNKLVAYTTADGRSILVEPGIQDPGKALGYPFSDVLVDLICEELANGAALTAVCRKPGFPPYSVLARWMRQREEVRNAIDQARRDRAEFLRDEAMAIVDDVAEESDAIAKAKARAEMRKWAAQVDDPGKYAKPEKSGQIQGSLHIVVDTGILRPGDAGFRDVSASLTELPLQVATATKEE